MPEGTWQLDSSLIRDSLASGKMRTGQLVSGEETFALSFGEITDNVIYIAMTPAEQIRSCLQLSTENSLASLRAAAEMSGGLTLILSENGGELEELERYGTMKDPDETLVSALSPDLIRSGKPFDLTAGGLSCRCVCTKADALWQDHDSVYVLQISPKYSQNSQVAFQTLMICLLMMVICSTMIVYAVSEQQFVIDNVLTDEQADRYNPATLHRRLLNAGIIGGIVILVVSILTLAVGQTSQQVRFGKVTLNILSGELEQSTEMGIEEARQAQEDWYVRYAEQAASYLEANPEGEREFRDAPCFSPMSFVF